MLDLKLINQMADQIMILWGMELIRLQRNASGALINSFTATIQQPTEFGLFVSIRGLDYWDVVEYGVPASNIPFTAGARTGAQNSKYIQGLIRWLKIKGVSSDNNVIKGIAFAIATKQTSKGKGWGLGNPMDKNKLGFIRRTQNEVNEQIQKIGQVYNKQIETMIMGSIPKAQLITI